MDLIQGLDAIDSPVKESILSIGNFDGVHLGHQAILRAAREAARSLRRPLIVMTFEPHPRTIIAPQRAPEKLCTLEDKIRMLDSLDVDMLVVARSEPELLSLSPQAFVRDIIRPRFHPLHFFEGRSFGFGKGRAGDVDMLKQLGQSYGFDVTIIEPVQLKCDDGQVCALSSSAIRDWLHQGDVVRAALGLNRPYTLTGTVAIGDARGKGLGFPTANLDRIDQMVPADGVYAGQVDVDGDTWAAAISIGVKPTFDRRQRTVEAYLLDYDGDLYKKGVRLIFLERLRDQRKFPSSAALTEQIARDVEAVRQITRRHRPEEVS